MRVALVHYWLVNHRGGEAVLAAFCRMFPEAEVFTLFYDAERVHPAIKAHRVHASFLNPLRRIYRSLLPLMPLALEQFDLRGYDLVISSESGPAKGVLVPSSARHVCYCHTPMRYLWDLYPAYLREWTPAWRRPFVAPLAGYLRLWDFASAARVDEFIANSRNVARRIRRSYHRDSRVIYPPVAVETFYHRPAEDYFLIVSELVPCKRIDLAVRAFSDSGRRLRIAGSGPDYRRLRAMAGSNIEFCGRVGEAELRDLYARCRAFVLPGEEDFGIAAVEALASGKPVVAMARGGALESIPQQPLGGVLFDEPAETSLNQAVAKLERLEAGINPVALRRYADQFSEAAFRRNIEEALALPRVSAAQHLGYSA